MGDDGEGQEAAESGVSRDAPAVAGDVFISGREVSAEERCEPTEAEGASAGGEGGALEVEAAPDATVLGALLGDTRAAGFGSLVRGGHLLGEDLAGLTGGALLPAEDCGDAAGQRRLVSWRLSLSRAVF